MQKKISYTAIGDIGIDIYPKLGKQFPGGTALNSAYHAAKAGAHASILSAIGNDKQGAYLTQFLSKHNISLDMLENKDGSTDTVEITLDKKGVPEYHSWRLGVLEKFELYDDHERFLNHQDTAIAVYHPELRRMFNGFAKMDLPNTLKIGDFTDLSEHKGNQDILREYSDSFDVIALSIDEEVDKRLASFSSFIATEKKIGTALLGKKGSVVIFQGKTYRQQAESVNVVDTTGAGDAYLATFVIEFLREKNISHAMSKATQKASQVIQHHGAIGV